MRPSPTPPPGTGSEGSFRRGGIPVKQHDIFTTGERITTGWGTDQTGPGREERPQLRDIRRGVEGREKRTGTRLKKKQKTDQDKKKEKEKGKTEEKKENKKE